MEKELSKKESVFVDEYVTVFNGTVAAIRAGYKETSARTQASRMLTKDNIKLAIAEKLEERKERNKIDADRLLAHCSEMLMADSGDIFDENENLKPIHEWPKIWRQMLNGIDVKKEIIKESLNLELFGINDGDKEDKKIIEKIIKAKFVAREKILELTGKHTNVGAFKENINHTGDLNIKIVRFTEKKDDN